MVLFSALNGEDHAIELMPSQVLHGGVRKSGKLIRKSRWTTAEQLPVTDFPMSRRRLGPGERADGVVVFQRPSFKQSNETLFLQMAESIAVDRPALAPIGFGIRRLDHRQRVNGCIRHQKVRRPSQIRLGGYLPRSVLNRFALGSPPDLSVTLTPKIAAHGRRLGIQPRRATPSLPRPRLARRNSLKSGPLRPRASGPIA